MAITASQSYSALAAALISGLLWAFQDGKKPNLLEIIEKEHLWKSTNWKTLGVLMKLLAAEENNGIQMGPHARGPVERGEEHEEHALLKELIRSVFQRN